MLKDEMELWGVPVVALTEYGRKFRWRMALLFTGDMFVVFSLTQMLYSLGLSYQAYGFVVLFVSLIFHFGFSNLLHPDRWEAYRFWRRHGGDALSVHRYRLSAVQMYGVLYCSGYRRVRTGLSRSEYMVMFPDACAGSSSRARKLMHYMGIYESENGDVEVVTIDGADGKKYFIKFVPVGDCKEDKKDGKSDTERAVRESGEV